MIFNKMSDIESNSKIMQCETQEDSLKLGKNMKCCEKDSEFLKRSMAGTRIGTVINSPLSSLEILTSNPLNRNYCREITNSANANCPHDNVDDDDVNKVVHSGRSSCNSNSNDSSQSSISSPGFSPLPFNNDNNCDLNGPISRMPDYHGRFLLSSTSSMAIPRKVPCVVLSASNMGSTTKFSPAIEEEERASNNNSLEGNNNVINYSRQLSSDNEDTRSRSATESPCSTISSIGHPAHEESQKIITQNDTKIQSQTTSKLTFGIDRILSQNDNVGSSKSTKEQNCAKQPEISNNSSAVSQHFIKSLQNHHYPHVPTSFPSSTADCPECILLTKYGYKIQPRGSTPSHSLIPSNYPQNSYGSFLPASALLGGSSLAWFQQQQQQQQANSHSHQQHHGGNFFDSSALISSNGFGHSNLPSSYGLSSTTYSSMSSMVACNTNGNGRRKRSWSRAVFSNLQRKGLEKRFQMQKYITKPDRRQLAAMLGLTDAQVKVWFQNRRMKWRHTKEGKSGSSTITASSSGNVGSTTASSNNKEKSIKK